MHACYTNHSFSSHYQVFWVSLDLRVYFRIWCVSNNEIQTWHIVTNVTTPQSIDV
jgi:hypothetical protein